MNHTTERFPRASHDDVLRSQRAWAGPYVADRGWRHWLIEAIAWAAAAVLLAGTFWLALAV